MRTISEAVGGILNKLFQLGLILLVMQFRQQNVWFLSS